MDDQAIIALFWARDEMAISETKTKYGRLCRGIARNILGSEEDAEECENDTYLKTWQAIPPQRPAVLPAYLGRIARNIALNRWKAGRADKRGGGEVTLSLDELGDCVSGQEDPDLDEGEVLVAIERFLDRLEQADRLVFLLRYWQLEPVAAIARRMAWSENKVTSRLFRLRKRLKSQLEKEGVCV
ncbi:MAG: sigma-70 family RNA polymerase sigma factor [Clostridiales bacterium]|nr:sigma-70 family RNA polymerase sigma factor [Clostridiales bacterium]